MKTHPRLRHMVPGLEEFTAKSSFGCFDASLRLSFGCSDGYLPQYFEFPCVYQSYPFYRELSAHSHGTLQEPVFRRDATGQWLCCDSCCYSPQGLFPVVVLASSRTCVCQRYETRPLRNSHYASDITIYDNTIPNFCQIFRHFFVNILKIRRNSPFISQNITFLLNY